MLTAACLLAALTASASLESRLRAIGAQAGGAVGLAVTHVETGETVSVNGTKPLPLYSVFKLPLAVTVLKDVEAGRLLLDRKVRVTPADVAPGSAANTERWREPVDRTVGELLELSIRESDNTSSDKLLELVGGPESVTERVRSLGFPGIDVRMSVREMSARRRVGANTGSALAVAALLTSLQQGQVLKPETRALLLDHMTQATTGRRRLRGELPPGTPVADKTGTGTDGTNDVGLITLPDGTHLAMTVLISGSKRSAEKQEDVIAALARAAYDSSIAPRAVEE
jgi:beta-lactamase class A